MSIRASDGRWLPDTVGSRLGSSERLAEDAGAVQGALGTARATPHRGEPTSEAQGRGSGWPVRQAPALEGGRR